MVLMQSKLIYDHGCFSPSVTHLLVLAGRKPYWIKLQMIQCDLCLKQIRSGSSKLGIVIISYRCVYDDLNPA